MKFLLVLRDRIQVAAWLNTLFYRRRNWGMLNRSILLLILLLVSSCDSKPEMVRVALTSKYLDSILDTSKIQYTNEFFLLENLTSRLVSFTESGEYELDLASDIKKEGNTKFRIKIRESYFSNGERITLSDVKNTFHRAIQNGSSFVNLNGYVKSIKIEQDALVIELKMPTNSFFYYLSLPDLGILHSSQIKDILQAKDFARVSSGPFRYEKKGEEDFHLVKNEYYKLSKVDYPKRVKLIVPFEADDVKDCFEGRLALARLPVKRLQETLKVLGENRHIKLIGHPSDNLSYLFFNKYSPNFTKIEHRRWLAQIINKHVVIPESLRGFVTKADQYFYSTSKAHLPGEELKKIIPSQIEKPKDFPKKLVIKAGVATFDVTFESIVRQLESIPDLEIEVQADLNLNKRMEIMKEGTHDIYLYVMSTDYRVPAEAVNIEYFSSVANLQDTTGKIEDHFIAYQASENETEAVSHLQEISKQMIKDSQVIPLFHSVSPYLVNTDLLDIRDIDPLFIYNFWKFKVK